MVQDSNHPNVRMNQPADGIFNVILDEDQKRLNYICVWTGDLVYIEPRDRISAMMIHRHQNHIYTLLRHRRGDWQRIVFATDL